MMMKRKKNSLEIDVEGKQIKKKNKGTLLGLTWDSNMTWKTQIAEVAMTFHDKVGGVKCATFWTSSTGSN